jgi:hypothetical protein
MTFRRRRSPARALREGLAGAIFIVPFVAAVRRIPYGFDLTDEGFALSVPLRLVFGDLPVRDEMMTAYMMFDVVMWPLYELFPSVTVLEARWIGLLLRLATALAWYLLMKRYAHPILVALAATAVSVPYLTYWEPGYDLLGSHLVLLGGCLWLHSFNRQGVVARLILPALGGLVFFLGMVAYVPLSLALAVPVLVLLATFTIRRARDLRPNTSAFCVVVLGCSVLGAALYLHAGLLEDLAYARHAMSSIGTYNSFSRMLFDKFIPEASDVMILGIGTAAATVILTFFLPKEKERFLWRTSVLVAFVALLSYLLATFDGQEFVRNFGPWTLTISISIGLNLAAPLLNRLPQSGPPVAERDWNVLRLVCLLLVASVFVLIGVSAGSGIRKTVFMIGPAFLVGVVAICRVARRIMCAKSAASYSVTAAAAGLCILLAVLSFRVNREMLSLIHRDAPRSELTASFESELLAGVYTSPKRVHQIDGLLDFLADRLQPGDFFLAYDEIPAIYFLTRTRPATNYVWARASRYDRSIRRDSVHMMVERGRVPRYCLRNSAWPYGRPWAQIPVDIRRSIDPFDQFVRRHYRRIMLIPGETSMEVFELKESSAALLLDYARQP